ncbi:MAG TPA: heavy-metal-associated domain-containing protein [Coleofasciculaceae cyanobacterium]
MTLQLTVPSMACGSCATAIARAVQEVDPQATVHGDPATKQVTIDTQVTPETVRAAIEAAGFPVE